MNAVRLLETAETPELRLKPSYAYVRDLEREVDALRTQVEQLRARPCGDPLHTVRRGEDVLKRLGVATATLTNTEFCIATLLAMQLGATVSHNAVLRAVWGAEYQGDAHLLRVNVSRLRLKVASSRFEIRTWPAVGYSGHERPA